MNEPRPKRPTLATIICIYLAVTAFIPVSIMWILVWGWFHSIFNYPPILLQTPISWLLCTLAIAGVIALWQMRRAAFLLLVARFVLSLTILVFNLPHSLAFLHRLSAISRRVGDSANRLIVASTVVEWLLNALIVWYVYRITAPQRLSPESAANATEIL